MAIFGVLAIVLILACAQAFRLIALARTDRALLSKQTSLLARQAALARIKSARRDATAPRFRQQLRRGDIAFTDKWRATVDREDCDSASRRRYDRIITALQSPQIRWLHFCEAFTLTAIVTM
ncbi:MAG: hypothetical protein WBO09_13440 [Methylocystis silviterrae]|uniref:hypothetical protein n=1 Tax=Methylocystis silviterrae TaxID=2743612 RepID=UPI003C71CF2E